MPDGGSEEQARRHLGRKAELDEAHRRLGFRLSSFLGLWGLELVRGTRAVPRQADPPVEVAGGELSVTWVGHSTALLRYAGIRVLTDPNLGDWVLALRRSRAAGLDAAALKPDLVLVSHAHHDHLHRASLRAVAPGAVCVVPLRCADLVADLGFKQVVELDIGATHAFSDSLEVTLVPAQHWGVRGLHDQKRRLFGGYVVRGPGPTAYFAGDTGYFSGFSELRKRFAPKVALLPIGGYSPASFRQMHLSPLDAAYAFEDLGAELMVPIHHGSYRLSYEPLDEPPRWLREIAERRGLTDKIALLDNGASCLVRA